MSDADQPTRRHNKWALVGVTAAGVVLALLVGWLGGLLVGKAFGPEDPATASSAAPEPSEPPPTSEEAAPGTPQPIAITEATLFDPPPGDGEENPDRLDLSYDGQEGTTWPTLQYKSTAKFGNIKPGVGIIYDLGSEVPVSQVTILTNLPGATVEIRTGSGTSGTIDDFAVVGGPVELDSSTEIPVAEGTTTRYVLVWITELVPQQGYFQAALSEVTIIGG